MLAFELMVGGAIEVGKLVLYLLLLLMLLVLVLLPLVAVLL